MHAQAPGDQDSQRLGDQLSPVLEESFDKLEVVVNEMKKQEMKKQQMKKEEVRDDK